MKLRTKVVAGIVTGALVVGFATSAFAVATSGWSFTGWHSGGSDPTTAYSSTWTSNSSNNTVVINGWQDAYGSPVADIEYAVVQDDLFGWGDHWVHNRITGNYPQSGTWYNSTFQGIPNGITIAIQRHIYNGSSTDGGGNAYQS